ncbi:zf-HC2 domain-containing protein [Amycolatopsis endophytica]|uniref:Putative anti-sigma-YlaC factor YlaD n=1 Tax=Amycolatopsis endophytica TaxID=860233 RepID=A0A853BAB8_9PSEU|nr:zf-HC2 domain-containing protein [Amycolatopsis endophytica]NYI91356.1 putative anti-sigma-YlaC factor YlaD [Amycolatopsis endophytica]
MRCETAREALSARIDGEPEPVPPETTDRHLTTCAGCRSYYANAQRLRRRMTVRSAPDVPDLTEVLLDRIPAPTGERWGTRIALALVAIAQLTLSAAQLFGVATGMPGMSGAMVGHLSHETTAWNAAIGLGLLWAALRPRAAIGQLPVLSGFVLVLAALSTADVVSGAVTAGRLASHGLVLAGLALLFVVRRRHTAGDGHPGTADSLRPGEHVDAGSSAAEPAAERHRPQRRRRRPTGHRRAA